MELNTVIISETNAEQWLFSLYGPFSPKKETLLTTGYEDGGASEQVQTLWTRKSPRAFAGNSTPIPQLPSPSRETGKVVPLQVWSGTEVSRKLRFPDFMTTAQDGGKFVRLKHRPPLLPGNDPGTHFCYRLCLPQGHSAIGRILMSEKFQWHQLGPNQRPSDL